MSKKSIHNADNTTVLVIEDDPWFMDVQAIRLNEAGYDVVRARHTLEAIELIDSVAPQVIIADVLLAGSTIFTLLHELQSHADTQVIPVVLCTSVAEQFMSTDLSHYGVRRVVDKTTMELDEIVVAVRSVLNGVSRED